MTLTLFSDLDLNYVTLALVMRSSEGIEEEKACDRLLWIIIFEDPFRSEFDIKTYSFCFISDCVGPPWKVSKAERG